MNMNALFAWGAFFIAVPILVVPAFLLALLLQRAASTRRRLGKRGRRGHSALVFSLGLAMQNLEALIYQDVEHVITATYDEDEDENGQGDPDDPAAHLNRQLRRIRRGEPVDSLIVPRGRPSHP
jgi:hypothetical protein